MIASNPTPDELRELGAAEADPLAPERIRALRGESSRAAFAARLGVTPNTIYRWELPRSAAEARRPRGAEREKLLRLVRGEPASAGPSNDASAATPQPTSDPTGSPSPLSMWLSEGAEDLAEALPSVERLFRGEARRAQSELVRLLATQRGLSTNARALACFGIAVSELVLGADAKRALLAISPALSDAEAGKLDAPIAGRVFAAAALVRALPDASLFDLGVVHSYGARAEALAARTDPETLCLALLASLSAAMLIGDRQLLERSYARLDDAGLGVLPPLFALHV
jgi:DNA-binding transcriptional regulator YiaG